MFQHISFYIKNLLLFSFFFLSFFFFELPGLFCLYSAYVVEQHFNFFKFDCGFGVILFCLFSVFFVETKFEFGAVRNTS